MALNIAVVNCNFHVMLKVCENSLMISQSFGLNDTTFFVVSIADNHLCVSSLSLISQSLISSPVTAVLTNHYANS